MQHLGVDAPGAAAGVPVAIEERDDPAGAAGVVATPRDFMSRVLPWPRPEEPGYVGLHWSSPNNPQPRLSKPFRKLDDFLHTAEQAAINDEYYKEVYFCLSLQEKTRQTQRGWPIADRKSPIRLKAIWLDIDVKPDQGDKHYISKEHARQSLNTFIKDTGLPHPTAVIDSGGYQSTGSVRTPSL